MTNYFRKIAFKIIMIVLMGIPQLSSACTGIVLEAIDGSYIRARTMEWGSFDIHAAITALPKGYSMFSVMSDGSRGLTWNTRYNVVGATGLGKLMFTDGINEAGLSAGIFYLPGFAEYPEYDSAYADVSISPSDFANYVLTSFATVAEVRSAMSKIRIVAVDEESLGFPAPVHYTVSDSSGETIVIEVVNKVLNIYDAPLGVITNAPGYDWHITNLRNYLNLSATSLPAKTLEEIDFSPLGVGSGMLGLPGDFTPPSRFVRAVAFTQTARPTNGGLETVRESFRILDNFNVPVHAIKEGGEHGKAGEKALASSTQFTTAADLENLRFYYHTQYNRRVRMVDLSAIDFTALDGKPLTLMMDEAPREDVLEVRMLRY